MSSNKRVYLIIHGHFYQPPRENPWTGKIGKEYGADPYRNWNEKIAREAYSPNAYSRILAPDGYVEDIVNNFSYLSYNFGPTLINWLAEYLPETYEKIVEADKVSQLQNHGCGNAIAQVYNHIIMPLANERDRRTQIEWGLFDFKRHFSRKAESIWLAETAINMDVVELLIEYGMKFVILSPYQAHSFRKLGEKDLVQCPNGDIDPSRPYRLFSKKQPKKYIDVFFYDGNISSAVSFEHLSRDSGTFVNRILDAASYKDSGDVLVNISTDGELYGHHEPFADMCLAYMFKEEAEKHGITVTNYSAYLKDHPPEYEAFLKEGEAGKGTSWSCCHGVARWERDCGCTTGGAGHWNQQWRTPLRQALNYLRDELAAVFEKEGSKYFKDVWAVRNDYINVIANRSKKSRDAFLKKHLGSGKITDKDRFKIWSLLESQHCALLMFTSCGWFFAEISGIESVQLMKYASMANEYVKRAFGVDFEAGFLSILQEAKSNIRNFGTGADVYRRKVLPFAIDAKQLLANYVMESYIIKDTSERRVFNCDFTSLEYSRKDLESGVCLVKGRLKSSDVCTEEQQFFEYVLAVHSYNDFRLYVYEFDPAEDFVGADTLDEELWSKLAGGRYYGLRDLIIEDRERVINMAIERRLEGLDESIQEIYEKNLEFLEGFQGIGLEVPEIVKTVASYVITKDINAEVEALKDAYNLDAYRELRRLYSYAGKFDLNVDKEKTQDMLNATLESGIEKAFAEKDTMLTGTLAYILDIADELGVKIRLDLFQNMIFALIRQEVAAFDSDPEKYGLDKKFQFFVKSLAKLAERLNIHSHLPF